MTIPTTRTAEFPSIDMDTQILPITEQSLLLAEQYLTKGELVAFHTETVYGLGADAQDDCAVQKIFAVKGRPADNPLIVHVHKDYDISRLVDEIPDYAEALAAAFLPGPLTMVYPSHGRVSKWVSCGMDTLAVRVPSSPAAQAFLRAVNRPVAAPSANLSKHVSPVTAEHVYDDFAGKIPLILDGGSCSGGIESTVLDCTRKTPLILREGLVTQEMIAKTVGECGKYTPAAGERPKSPGMAYKHYSPRCKTAYFLRQELSCAEELYRAEEAAGNIPCFVCESSLFKKLSGAYRALDLGDTAEQMARSLYALLREGEKRYSLLIAIEPTVRGGAIEGVLNRLSRAFGRT